MVKDCCPRVAGDCDPDGRARCRSRYDVRFQLRYSVRPWASQPAPDAISGTTGALLHAEWFSSSREVPAVKLWDRISNRGDGDRLVHLLHDGWTIVATFPAIDDPRR